MGARRIYAQVRWRGVRAGDPMVLRSAVVLLSILFAVFPLLAEVPQPAPAMSALPVSGAAAASGPAAQIPETILEIGIEERVRLEDFSNTGDFSFALQDVQQRTRIRTKIWTKWTPTHSLEFYVRLGNEFKKTSEPSVRWGRSAPDEGFIDNLYVDFKKLIVPGLSLKLGRQDMVKGEGFLLMDYTAGDGSRSIYMNGIDLAFSFRKASLHLLGVAATRKDHYLPLISDAERFVNESDNSMIGLYYEAKPRTSTEVDAYWLYNSQVRDYRFPTSAAFIPDRHFSSVGGRVSHRVRRAFTVGGEFAYQFGNQRGNAQRSVPNANVRAWGGYGHVRRDFDHSWKPFVQVAEYFYSGDEHEADDRANGFDPVFGRWPGRSELLAYGLQTEKGFGYYSNLRLTGIQGGFLPLKQWKNTLSYYRVDAFHPNRAGSPHIFGSGTHRGDLFGVKSEVALKDHWKAHLMYERMLPGDFYVGDNHAHFFRVELMYTFKAVLSR